MVSVFSKDLMTKGPAKKKRQGGLLWGLMQGLTPKTGKPGYLLNEGNWWELRGDKQPQPSLHGGGCPLAGLPSGTQKYLHQGIWRDGLFGWEDRTFNTKRTGSSDGIPESAGFRS